MDNDNLTVDDIIRLMQAGQTHNVAKLVVGDVELEFHHNYNLYKQAGMVPQQEIKRESTQPMVRTWPEMKAVNVNVDEQEFNEPPGDSLLDLLQHPTNDLINPPDHEPST